MDPELEAGFDVETMGLTGTGECWDEIQTLSIAPRRGRILDREIWVTFQKEGVHKYPAALEDPALADVSFLGYPHRHIFHFRVGVTVTHNDRDIEFILFKRELENLYSDGIMQMDYKSCEMLAEELIAYIGKNYPNRKIVVSVSEDNENGATLTWLP
jgi:hypothetical protein